MSNAINVTVSQQGTTYTVSPQTAGTTFNVATTAEGATIDVDVNTGGNTFNVSIVATGPAGEDGFSPVVSSEEISGGHRLSIQDATHTETFDVMDGATSWSQIQGKPTTISGFGITDAYTKDEIDDEVIDKIPAQATASNQLADKDFVNSSIATNTAYYISNQGEPFTSVAQLEAYSGTVTNNDYAFVTGTDTEGNTYYDRYKATVTTAVSWAKEFRLNNSSFTAVQWSAITSGITASLVLSYNTHIANTSIHTTSAEKAVWNGKEDNIPQQATAPSNPAEGDLWIDTDEDGANIEWGGIGGDIEDQTDLCECFAGGDAWVSGTSYSVGDVCIYDNTAYRCIVANSASTFSTSNFEEISLKSIRNGQFLNGTITELVSLTSGTAVSYTVLEDGYYFVKAINTTSSGSNSAYILDANNSDYISAVSAPNGTYIRSTTALVPFKKGTTFYARAFFTASGYICKLT